MSIVRVKDFNLDSLNVSELRKNKAGGKAVYLKYSLGRKNKACEYDNNLEVEETNLQNLILQTDILNVKEFSTNSLTVNCMDSLFLEVIQQIESHATEKFSTETNKLRSLINENSVKLNIIEDKTLMFDSEKKVISLLENNTNVQLLIQPIGIWIKDDEYGMSCRLLQVKVLEKEELLQEYAFIDDENEFYDIVPNDF